MMRNCRGGVWLLCMMMLVGIGCSGDPEPARDIAPEADKALKAMGTLLDAATSYSFEVHVLMDEETETGQLIQISRKGKVFVQRPNKLVVEREGDDFNRKLWYNGKTLTVLDRENNVYTVVDVPDTIEKMIDFIVAEYGVTPALADLLYPNVYDVLTESVEDAEYQGIGEIGGVKCHHLLFHQELIDWQIWIDAGETPVPLKVVITYKEEEGSPRYVARLSNWNLNATYADGTFDFKAPEKAEKISIEEMVAEEEEVDDE